MPGLVEWRTFLLNLAYCSKNDFTLRNFRQYVLDLRRPDKGLWFALVYFKKFIDSLLELRHASEYATADSLVGDLTKPTLHQIQPGSACRCDVQLKPRVARQPFLHIGMFVNAVVVDDQVQCLALGKRPIQST